MERDGTRVKEELGPVERARLLQNVVKLWIVKRLYEFVLFVQASRFFLLSFFFHSPLHSSSSVILSLSLSLSSPSLFSPLFSPSPPLLFMLTITRIFLDRNNNLFRFPIDHSTFKYETSEDSLSRKRRFCFFILFDRERGTTRERGSYLSPGVYPMNKRGAIENLEIAEVLRDVSARKGIEACSSRERRKGARLEARH